MPLLYYRTSLTHTCVILQTATQTHINQDTVKRLRTSALRPKRVRHTPHLQAHTHTLERLLLF